MVDLVTIGGGGGLDDNNGGGGVEDSKHCNSPESVCNFSVDQEKGHSGKEPMYIYVLHKVKRFNAEKGDFTSLSSLSLFSSLISFFVISVSSTEFSQVM